MERISQKKTDSTAKPEYLIYFVDKDELHWWDHVFHTRAGFRHCWVLCWDQWSHRWLMMDWRRKKLDTMILFNFEEVQLRKYMEPAKLTVVRYEATDCEGNDPIFLSYCSNIIAKLLGLGDSLILTPYQLYRKLMAAGGEVIYDWRIDHDSEQPESHTRATAA